MKTLSAARLILASLVLFSSSACKKTDPEAEGLSFVDGVPYYHFTDNDRRWLGTKSGDEWKMENARGYQRVYRASVIVDDIQKARYHNPPGSIVTSSKPMEYQDIKYVRLARTDSLAGFSELRFYREAARRTNYPAGGFDPDKSEFYAQGEWVDFVGNSDPYVGVYYCRGLNMPSGAALNGSFQQLTVRGQQYNDVVAFIGTSRGPTCTPVPSSYMQELYYDRRAGLVRMVSLAGEVWDRVP